METGETLVLARGWFRNPAPKTRVRSLNVVEPEATFFSHSEILTPKTMAERLGLTRKTITRWINEGDLEAERLRKGYRIKGRQANECLARFKTRR